MGDASLLDALQNIVDDSHVFEAVVALEPNDVTGDRGSTALLAVRPDGYVGMRCERDHLAALERYQTLLTGAATIV
jgi:hypothetical protein